MGAEFQQAIRNPVITNTWAGGMAIVEIVGFQGQTVSTTYFEIQTASTIIYVKINYQSTGLTDSGAVLIFQI